MRLRYIIVGLALAVGAVVAIYGAVQPDAGLLRFKVKGDVAYGYGGTDDRSVSQISRFIENNPQVKTLVLKKMPGTVDADMNNRLARIIRRAGLNTHLDRNSTIASGAVDLFLAGVERTMDCGALIGVHSWSGGRSYYPAKIGHDPRQKRQEKFLSDMGIDPAFYAFTRDSALPHDMHYMSAEDIKQFGLLTEDPDCG